MRRCFATISLLLMAIASDLTNLSPNKHKRLIRSTFSQGHLPQLYVIKRFA
jgi:hypothetical protein